MRIGFKSFNNAAIIIAGTACAAMTAMVLTQDYKMTKAKEEILEKDSNRYNALIGTEQMPFRDKYNLWMNELSKMRDSLAVENYSRLK